MSCQFSADGKYFAQLSGESQLKIWNTLTNSFEQEFTPNINLTSPCTCLHFLSPIITTIGAPSRKKRRESSENQVKLALGTSSGKLLVYSVTKSDLVDVIDSAASQAINCLSISEDTVYTGTDTNILVWSLSKRKLLSKWGSENDKISSILIIPQNEKLLTASKLIKLWDVESKEVIKTFTGHASQVTLLYYISPGHFISGSKGDRLLSCWSLNENEGKGLVASFSLEDTVSNVSVNSNTDGSTNIAATVRNGVVHIFQHIFNNSKSSKPIKPKSTVQVVSDSKDGITPIHVVAASHRDCETLCLCYGSSVIHVFEDIKLSHEKIQCLLRENPHKNYQNGTQISKIKTPVVDQVHYLSMQSSSAPTKRKNEVPQEIPMEKRLENLMMDDDGGSIPKGNNMAKLLIQGLHSKDKNILRMVLFKKDEQLIKNTIKRLPYKVITSLFDELTKMIQGKTLARHIALIWLRNLMLVHSALFLSNPDLPALFGEVLGCIEANLALQVPRTKLLGRLELLVAQVEQVSEENVDDEAALVFNDKVLSDSEDDGMDFEEESHSENEDESWFEEDSDAEK